jgi:hypothetical protein
LLHRDQSSLIGGKGKRSLIAFNYFLRLYEPVLPFSVGSFGKSQCAGKSRPCMTTMPDFEYRTPSDNKILFSEVCASHRGIYTTPSYPSAGSASPRGQYIREGWMRGMAGRCRMPVSGCRIVGGCRMASSSCCRCRQHLQVYTAANATAGAHFTIFGIKHLHLQDPRRPIFGYEKMGL